MKQTKITLSLIFLILMSMLVYSIVTEYVSPADDFYLIKGGAVMGNLSFEVNATPTGSTGIIHNISLYHNISGTFVLNYTNDTTATVATETNRIFIPSDTSLYSHTLSDGLVFVWNAYACDNISKFYDEDVSLDADLFTIFDNYTNTTGDGICIVNCTNAIKIKAGRGRTAYYPISTLDAVMNTTGEVIVGCQLNGSSDGYFRCNQTLETYNGSGLINTTSLITSSVKVNYTISSSCRFIGANRTVYVEDAPSITLIAPSDSGYVTDDTIIFNYNVTGDSDTDLYTCQLYSNDTGNWTPKGGANNAINNTNETTSKVFSEGNGLIWNVRCSESTKENIYGWALNNFTITVDTTNPVITSSAKTYYINKIAADGFSAFVNLSVVDNNNDSCRLYINGSLNNTLAYTSSTAFAQFFNASDGNYNWMVTCNDTASRTASTANTSVTIDTVMPSLSSYKNGSDITNCTAWALNFTMNEASNFTLEYGLSDNSRTYSDKETDYELTQTLELNFNESYETVFYANFTFCDIAGNCNTTENALFTSPIPLCTGWSLWSVYDSVINLSDYRAASGADYVYYWNNTGQTWIYSSAAGSEGDGYNMGVGDIVQLYESTNTTYFRNSTGTPGYYINITGGHVYFGLYHAYSFGNISYNIFRNESGGNFTPSGIWAGALETDINYLSGFNNSNQLYVDAPYLWVWNNATTLGKPYKNGLDTLWAYIDYNISINFTPGGEIIGNWT